MPAGRRLTAWGEEAWVPMNDFRRTLVLVRHGQSEDNARDLFSGLRDPALTSHGVEEAHAAGRALKALGVAVGHAFTSKLRRAQQTLALILAELGLPDMPVQTDSALNERDYGALAGLNKTEARARFGVEQVRSWRKSYDAAPPSGESLAMTAVRAWGFYEQAIAPRLRDGGCVLVVGHGNTLRAMLMRLDGISANDIEDVNVGTAEILFYGMAQDGGLNRLRLEPKP
jgi:2,3-bisphosphoglycerate-dependent phosphoglycerate mutase